MSAPKGPPCPTCGRPTPISKDPGQIREWQAISRERAREQRKEYARRYYLTVTKPRRAGRGRGEPG